MLGSPKRTSFTSLPFLAKTALFFDLPGVFLGLFYPENVSPRYFKRPEGSLSTFLVVAKTASLIEKGHACNIGKRGMNVRIKFHAFFRNS
jgi:hypothetical protein